MDVVEHPRIRARRRVVAAQADLHQAIRTAKVLRPTVFAVTIISGALLTLRFDQNPGFLLLQVTALVVAAYWTLSSLERRVEVRRARLRRASQPPLVPPDRPFSPLAS